MSTKKCCTCREVKSRTEFNVQRSRADGLQVFCRDCSKSRFKSYYQENRTHIRASNAIQREESVRQCRRYVASHFKENPCKDCGTADIRVLEFDHLDSEEKRDGVMSLVNNGASLATIKTEIAKCEVRCRNCHIIKTYDRIGGTWHDEFIGV